MDKNLRLKLAALSAVAVSGVVVGAASADPLPQATVLHNGHEITVSCNAVLHSQFDSSDPAEQASYLRAAEQCNKAAAVG